MLVDLLTQKVELGSQFSQLVVTVHGQGLVLLAAGEALHSGGDLAQGPQGNPTQSQAGRQGHGEGRGRHEKTPGHETDQFAPEQGGGDTHPDHSEWVPTQRHGDLSLEDLGRAGESAKKGERVLPRHRIECLAGRE
jgi:hypothetical protein